MSNYTEISGNIALCFGEIDRREALILRPETPYIGFFDTVNPCLIYRGKNKNRGQLSPCLKNGCALSYPSSQDLQNDDLKADVKTVMS
jgi:hypothetical protein